MATVVCRNENCVINCFISLMQLSSPLRINSSNSAGLSSVVISFIGVRRERIGRHPLFKVLASKLQKLEFWSPPSTDVVAALVADADDDVDNGGEEVCIAAEDEHACEIVCERALEKIFEFGTEIPLTVVGNKKCCAKF